MSPLPATAQVGVDALLLANGAEVQNGLVDVVFRVPWSETDAQQEFPTSAQDEGSRHVGDPVEGAFIAGRKPDLTPGASQVVVAAVPCRVQLPRMGLYDVVADLNDVEAARIQFEATANTTAASLAGGRRPSP